MIQKSKPVLVIIEDNPTDAFVLKRLLKSCEMAEDSTFFSNAEDALNFLKSRSATHGFANAIVITDVKMPGMNGHELVAEIRNTPSIAATPVFVHSTSDDPADIRAAYANLICGYVVKDMDGRAILNLLKCARHLRDAVTLA